MSFDENLSLQFSAWGTALVRSVFVAACNGYLLHRFKSGRKSCNAPCSVPLHYRGYRASFERSKVFLTVQI